MGALWAYTGPPDPAIDRAMSRALHHRGSLPGTGGLLKRKDLTVGVALPHPDASLGGLVQDRHGDWALAAVGRLRSPRTIDELARRWRERGDAAFLTTSLDAIVIAVQERQLSIVRDPAGVRTIYWALHEGRIFVAIEPKGIAAVPGFRREVDPIALAQFLTFSFVPGQRCSLAGLNELMAGHRLDIDLRTGAITQQRWFVHEEGSASTDDPHDWVKPVRQAVDTAVDDRLPRGEPVAAFLSGGLDSSIVVASSTRSRRETGDPPPITFSLHFGHKLPNELEWSRAVADHVGTDHRVIEVRGRDVRDMLYDMVWHLDEPIGDPVTVGNFALARAAAGESRWVLNGEGGDPLFGGPKNLPMLLAHWYPTLGESISREQQYLATWRRAGEEVSSLLHPDLRSGFDHERDLIGVIRPYFSTNTPEHFLNKLMVANMRLKGAHLILPKVDRMLGAQALTPLAPLFDPELIRLSMTMPPQAKLRRGVEKWILKAAFTDALPYDVIHRPKSGMRVPVHEWFKHDLRRFARDILSPRAVRRAGVFDPRRVDDVLHYRTGRDGLRLWMLLTFELWRRIVIDGEQP